MKSVKSLIQFAVVTGSVQLSQPCAAATAWNELERYFIKVRDEGMIAKYTSDELNYQEMDHFLCRMPAMTADRREAWALEIVPDANIMPTYRSLEPCQWLVLPQKPPPNEAPDFPATFGIVMPMRFNDDTKPVSIAGPSKGSMEPHLILSEERSLRFIGLTRSELMKKDSVGKAELKLVTLHRQEQPVYDCDMVGLTKGDKRTKHLYTAETRAQFKQIGVQIKTCRSFDLWLQPASFELGKGEEEFKQQLEEEEVEKMEKMIRRKLRNFKEHIQNKGPQDEDERKAWVKRMKKLNNKLVQDYPVDAEERAWRREQKKMMEDEENDGEPPRYALRIPRTSGRRVLVDEYKDSKSFSKRIKAINKKAKELARKSTRKLSEKLAAPGEWNMLGKRVGGPSEDGKYGIHPPHSESETDHRELQRDAEKPKDKKHQISRTPSQSIAIPQQSHHEPPRTAGERHSPNGVFKMGDYVMMNSSPIVLQIIGTDSEGFHLVRPPWDGRSKEMKNNLLRVNPVTLKLVRSLDPIPIDSKLKPPYVDERLDGYSDTYFNLHISKKLLELEKAKVKKAAADQKITDGEDTEEMKSLSEEAAADAVRISLGIYQLTKMAAVNKKLLNELSETRDVETTRQMNRKKSGWEEKPAYFGFSTNLGGVDARAGIYEKLLSDFEIPESVSGMNSRISQNSLGSAEKSKSMDPE